MHNENVKPVDSRRRWISLANVWWLRTGAAIAVLVAGALIWPYVGMLIQTPLRFAVPAALAAWLLSRRRLDALLMGVLVCVVDWVEHMVAPAAFSVLVLSLLCLSRRPRFAMVLGTSVFAFGIAAILLKVRFAGTPLTWQDLHFFFAEFRDNLAVFETQPTLMVIAASAAGLLLAAGYVGWGLDRRRTTVPLAALVCGISAASITVVNAASVVEDAANRLRGRGAWVVGATDPGNSMVSRFVATAGLMPNFNLQRVDSQLISAKVAQLRTGAASGDPAAMADIVVFLQESQFNPLALPDCPPSLCRLGVFGSGPSTLMHGPLQVHVHGGGTWLTEFSLASGFPHDLFGPAGAFAPFNVAPALRRSFAGSLRAAGYRTVALYPVRGGMMNARRAYEAYGFDRFYDSDDAGLSGRFDTPDEDIHAAARRILDHERKAGKPVFLQVVTIFNHGDHGIRMDRVPPALRQGIARAFADPVEYTNVSDYLWRSQLFEEAMRKTSNELLTGERKVVLAWFGDHQPPFGRAPRLRRAMRSVWIGPGQIAPDRVTWYHVAANGAKLARQADPQPLDIVFMPGVLARMAGVPPDDWLAANIVAHAECRGALTSCPASVRDTYFSYLIYDLQVLSPNLRDRYATMAKGS